MGKAKQTRWNESLDPKLVKLIEAKLTVTEAAHQLGFSRTTVGKQVKRLGLSSFALLSDEEKATIRRMHGQGKSDHQIAKSLNRSLGIVHKHRVQMGLEANFKGGRRKRVTKPDGRYTLAQLMSPTNHRPGTPEREDIEKQRRANGIQNHVLDAR